MLRLRRGATPPLLSMLFLFLLAVGLAMTLDAQQKAEIKKVPPAATSAADGAEMFRTYCAVCHGVDGKGKGPAVSALKAPPKDLTLLTRTSGGKFPELQVYNAIRGEVGVTAHGSKDMPIWGDVLRGRGDTSVVNLRLRNLTKYIESIQAK